LGLKYFVIVLMGDDRAVETVYVAGRDALRR